MNKFKNTGPGNCAGRLRLMIVSALGIFAALGAMASPAAPPPKVATVAAIVINSDNKANLVAVNGANVGDVGKEGNSFGATLAVANVSDSSSIDRAKAPNAENTAGIDGTKSIAVAPPADVSIVRSDTSAPNLVVSAFVKIAENGADLVALNAAPPNAPNVISNAGTEVNGPPKAVV